MKVCLLGPVVTSSYYGGVAVFDEELAQGFIDNGCEAILATTQKDAKMGNIPLGVVTKNNFQAFLEHEKPDLIIASLGYAKVLPRKCQARVAYFLHGFFLQSYYGVIKSFMASNYQKWLIKKCDLVFANSYFTRMINKEFFEIKTDAVFHLGVSKAFIESSTQDETIEKIPNSILFAGRLVKAKGIDTIIEAAYCLKKKGISFKLYIAGNGPEKSGIVQYAKEKNSNIELLGRLDSKKMFEWYRKSEVFISLNPSEPFGIVFPEALISGCKIVCPLTGGQIEYLRDYLDTVAFVNETDAGSVAMGIKKLFEQGNPVTNIDECKNRFNYKRVAAEIIDYIGE